MNRFWIDCFVWDIEAEGIESALTRLRGDLGADEIRLLAVADELTHLRGRSIGDEPSRVLPLDAAAHFRHDPKHYKATRLRPPTAAWMKSRDPFSKIVTAARELGLTVSARVEGLANATLARKLPMACCVNVFGDVSQLRLCPANPDVREYLAALCSELAEEHETATVELAEVGFGPFFELPSLHGRTQTDARTEDLLRWCFCSACRQAASEAEIDIDATEAAVRSAIDEGLRRPRDVAVGDDGGVIFADENANHENVLPRFQALRGRIVQRLVDLVRARIGDRLTVHLDVFSRSHCIPKSVAEVSFVNWERVQHWRKAHESFDLDLSAGLEPHAIRFDAMPPYCADGPALVSRVHEAVEEGFTRIGFYCDGLWPAPSLDWVRQAIRYARRES